MATLKKKTEIKKYLDLQNDSKATFAKKKSFLAVTRLDKPLSSWPEDKPSLLNIIKDYMVRVEDDNVAAAFQVNKGNTLDIKPFELSEDAKKEVSNEGSAEGASETESSSEQVQEKTKEETPAEDASDYVDEGEYVDLPDQMNDIDNCSAKTLASVVRILHHRSKILKKIKLMKASGLMLHELNNEIEKVVIYNIVLAKYLPILNKQATLDTINLKTATKLFEDVCGEGYEEIPSQNNIEDEIKKNKEEQDFDIVSALSYVGVSVDKDDFGYYSIMTHNNGQGIKYFIGRQEKSFALSKNACKKFVDDFLNKPLESRKFITPGQVFIAYIGEAEQSLGINTRSTVELNDLFGTMKGSKNAKSYFKDVIKRFSRNAPEWKDYQKLFYGEYYSNKESSDETANKIHIRQQAKRLVISDFFEEFLNDAGLLSEEQIYNSDYRASDISRDFGLDIDLDGIGVNKVRIERLEDLAFRAINAMHSTLQDLRGFTQDIIDNYTVDYLRKEKIFLLQQDDQNEFIQKKKDYEDLIERLSYDKSKDSEQQIVYYRTQIEELVQKIGNQEYRDSKDDLIASKNNYRILLLNTKLQKELVKTALTEAEVKAAADKKVLTDKEKVAILKEVLGDMPELVFKFDKGKATSWTKHKVGEKAVKRQEPLTEIDKVIEKTAAKISDESHQKIMEENKIRESIKKSQKEERVKSANAYINAYGSIVGNAAGVGGFNQLVAPQGPLGIPLGAGGGAIPSYRNSNYLQGGSPINFSAPGDAGNAGASGTGFGGGAGMGGAGSTASGVGGAGAGMGGGYAPSAPAYAGNAAGYAPVAPVASVAPVAPVAAAPIATASNQVNIKDNYENFDYMSSNIEPCVIPYIVGYDVKGVTTYGNKMETYAIFDRYRFLLETRNNALYEYIETKQQQVQTPEQIIADLHIRYIKNAMAKSGLSTIDSNIAKFDYKDDVRKYLVQYVPQNLIDVVISDYNELCASIDFELLKDLIEHRFAGDLSSYVPDVIRADIQTCANMIASVAKAIMTDANVRSTYDAYSSKMKQSYVSSLVAKIESGQVPLIKLSSDEVYSRMLDYISFSIKAQNVIIQMEDAKDSGLASYPRSIFFRQKENADNALNSGKLLTFEQNEVITTRNDPTIEGGQVVNLFGPLYKFNGPFNKLLLRLKPFNLAGGVKFMENLVDALKENLNVKITVLSNEDESKSSAPLVKFASQEREKRKNNTDITFDYEDENWYVLRDFVLGKNKVTEVAMLIAFGLKYALDRNKTKLKEDFYENNLLSLPKINKAFDKLTEETKSLVTSVIRNIMMSKSERMIDFVEDVKKQYSLYINRMLYINRTIVESNNFDKKPKEEKLSTIEALDADFTAKSEDNKNPHPEIYGTIEEINHYFDLYLYYALNDLSLKIPDEKEIITPKFEEYFEELKKKLRNNLLAKIRDKVYMNGYEEEISRYFELNMDRVITEETRPIEDEEEEEEISTPKTRVKLANIDVIFRGIYEGFDKAIKKEKDNSIISQMEELGNILELVGTLPDKNTEEQDLEIPLPNNHTIRCNIKGFIQQYIFRYIVDKSNELGPFAYVVNELSQHETFGEIVKNLEMVTIKLNEQELGINLFEKFSSITLSNNGNIFKVGDNITTAVETINRLKLPTDIQKALNRDVFYKEGVNGVEKSFEQYFNRLKLEKMD